MTLDGTLTARQSSRSAAAAVFIAACTAAPLAASLAVPASTMAQAPSGTNERALARDLFHQGIACLDADDLDCAAERFARSHELQPSAVVAYNLASTNARRGKVVTAAELLRWIDRDQAASAEVRAAAVELLRRVEPRIAHWTLHVDTSRSAQLFLDGRQLPPQTVGIRAPVDPGEHRVQARRDGEVVAEALFHVEAQHHEEVHLDVPPAPPSPSNIARASQDGDNTRVITLVRTNEEDPDTERKRRRRRIAGGVAAAVAVVALAVAVGVILYEPRVADPIVGNLTPGVVIIGGGA